MLFQSAPIIPVYALVAILMLLLAARTWQLRPARGATAWSMVLIFCAIHAIGTSLEIAFAIPLWKLAMNRLIYLGTTGMVFTWGIFAIQYSGEDRLLNRITLSLLAAVPLFILCLALFAEQHTLLYRRYEFVSVDGLLMGRVAEYGVMFWVWVGYSYLVMFASWLLLLRSAIRSGKMFRSQTRLVILASGAPLAAYIAQILGITPAPFYPLAFTMVFSGIVMLLAMTRFRFMDIIPVAYDLIFRNVNSGIILVDLKGRVVEMNRTAEQITGCREKDARGKTALEAFPAQQHIVEQFWGVTEIKTEFAIPETERHYELQIAPLTNYHGELAGRLVMFYDITERKKVEQQTLELAMERERVRLLQQFVSHMSHDLRTPLAGVKLSHYILRKELAGQHSARLDTLDAQTERLIEMVESMLTLLRLEEAAPGSLLDVDVNELMTYAIQRHQKLASERGSHIRFNPTRDLPHVLANSEELSLAFSNLVVNAIHFAPNGEISITTTQDADRVVVCVRDSGIGIDAEDLSHIFERFYRADSSRGTQNGGLGLGLTITKTVVDRHSGTIDVESQPGKGSEFSIRLPRANAV